MASKCRAGSWTNSAMRHRDAWKSALCVHLARFQNGAATKAKPAPTRYAPEANTRHTQHEDTRKTAASCGRRPNNNLQSECSDLLSLNTTQNNKKLDLPNSSALQNYVAVPTLEGQIERNVFLITGRMHSNISAHMLIDTWMHRTMNT